MKEHATRIAIERRGLVIQAITFALEQSSQGRLFSAPFIALSYVRSLAKEPLKPSANSAKLWRSSIVTTMDLPEARFWLR